MLQKVRRRRRFGRSPPVELIEAWKATIFDDVTTRTLFLQLRSSATNGVCHSRAIHSFILQELTHERPSLARQLQTLIDRRQALSDSKNCCNLYFFSEQIELVADELLDELVVALPGETHNHLGEVDEIHLRQEDETWTVIEDIDGDIVVGRRSFTS